MSIEKILWDFFRMATPEIEEAKTRMLAEILKVLPKKEMCEDEECDICINELQMLDACKSAIKKLWGEK